MSKISLRIFVTWFKLNKPYKKNSIIITDADYDYILDEIERHEKIEFENNVSVNSYDE